MGRGACGRVGVGEPRLDLQLLAGRRVARFLITLGVVLILAGLLWPWLQKMGLGRLPGDIVIERGNVRFYFPLATSLLISLLLTLLFWLLGR
jgi:hypothetical protein